MSNQKKDLLVACIFGILLKSVHNVSKHVKWGHVHNDIICVGFLIEFDETNQIFTISWEHIAKG